MKKIKIQGKLSLNKSTIASLNREELNEVKGGASTKSEMKRCGDPFSDVMSLGTCDWLSAGGYC